MFDTIHRILPIRARSRQCMREHNCHRLSILFLRNERIATSGLQNIKIRFLLDYYLWQFFRELRRMDTLRNDARYSSSTRFYRPKLFLHLDLSFRECEGYAWILYPDCVSCNVYFINRPELDVAELFYFANDRITLLYPTRFVRVFFVAFMNRVDIKISSKLVPIRILLERRRNESVHRECDERVRRVTKSRQANAEDGVLGEKEERGATGSRSWRLEAK